MVWAYLPPRVPVVMALAMATMMPASAGIIDLVPALHI